MNPQMELELNEIIETARKIAIDCKERRSRIRISQSEFKRIKQKYLFTQVKQGEYKNHWQSEPSIVESLLRKAEKLAKKLRKNIRPLVNEIRKQAYIGAMQCSIFYAKECAEENNHYGRGHLIDAKCFARKAGIDTTPQIQGLEEIFGPHVFTDLVIERIGMCFLASLALPVVAMIMAFVLSGPYVQNHDFILWPLLPIAFALFLSMSLTISATEFMPKYFLLRKPFR